MLIGRNKMDKFLTLIKLEYFKRKKSYWLPVWIISGVVGLILVVVLLAWISNNPNVNIHLDDFVFDKDDIRMEVRMTSYGFTVGIAWIFGLFMLMSAQNSLSKEKQLGCELFYKCQPVSIWENTASKYIMHVLANSVALLAVGLIFAVIIAIVTSISYGSFNIMNTVFGAFLGSITYLKICLIFGSLFFLFSAVFNGNSFLKGLGALGLLEGVI